MESPRLKRLQDFLSENPNDAFLNFALAKEYEGLGADDKALEVYQKLCKEQPDYVGTYYHLGKLYEKRGAIEQAFQTYKSGMAVAKTAGDQHALSELAGAKLSLGDDEDFE